MNTRHSLERPLIAYPLLSHFAVLLVSFVTIVAVATRLDSGGPYADEQITRIIAQSIYRNGDGRLTVRTTPELAELRETSNDLWFVAQDDVGRSITFGRVPRHYASIVDGLNGLSYAQLRARYSPHDLTAVIRREAAPAGALTILAHGKLIELTFAVLVASNVIVLPIFLLLALTSLAVTPWIVRRSLAGIARVAHEAEQIDVSRRGRRISEELMPVEITPFVRAVNDALARLDEGYERQRRFIASAAHELRTPVAVLRLKIDAAQELSTRRLQADVGRLSTLIEQLLDVQRLDTDRKDEPLNPGVLVRRVVGDLAPLLIASGRTIEVRIEREQPLRGDAASLERVVTNLIQNAIEHGGRHVTVCVVGAVIEVEDDGPGIPVGERERVFEPFHRLRPSSTGSGLGLNLVRQVVERHGGRVWITDAAGGGTVVRVDLSGY